MEQFDMVDDISDVSVVICTRNNKDNIEEVVQSIIEEKPKELIVVDGNSTDGTREILKKMPVKVLSDPGKGLALARQIALNEVAGTYVLFVGDDNIILQGSILQLKRYMNSHGWIGAAFQTRIKGANSSYWAYCANWRWKSRFFEGERSVIGTPYIFQTDILRSAGYDINCTDSDDSDIEERLRLLTTKKFGYSNVICLEIGKTGFHETIVRFLIYGKSDAQFWKKYSPTWKWSRKWISICHPINDELINPLKRIDPLTTRIKVFPYFLFITIVRYVSWIRESLKMGRK